MKTFRIGLIGCGDIAEERHIPTLLQTPRAEIACVCDTCQEKVDAIQRKFQIARGCTNYKEILSDESIDAVVVATPPWITPKITVEALESGKHVLCEKPMAVEISEAERVAEVERRTGKKVMMGFTYRNDPLLQRMRTWIAQGKIGSPVFYRMGFFDEVWNPVGNPAHYEKIDQTMKHGCPSVHDGAHGADFLNLLTDASPVKAVHAFGLKSRPEFATSNYDISIIDFENGDRAKLEIGWFYPAFPYGEFEAVGPEGTIEYDRFKRYVRLKHREEIEEVRDDLDWWADCFRLMYERFFDSSEFDRPCMPGTAEGLYSLKLTKQIEAEMKGVISNDRP